MQKRLGYIAGIIAFLVSMFSWHPWATYAFAFVGIVAFLVALAPDVASFVKQGAPNAPITQMSLHAYCKSHPLPLEIAERIANSRRIKFKDLDTDFNWMIEKVEYLGINTVKELNRLLKKYKNDVVALSNHMTLVGGIDTGFVIDMLFYIKAINDGGLNKLSEFVSHGSLSCADAGFADDVYKSYLHVKKYKA